MFINEDKMMYIVFEQGDILAINAICASEDAVGRYLEDERKLLEESFVSEPPVPKIDRIKTFFYKEYEIAVPAIKYDYQIIRSKLIGFDDMLKSDVKKVWVAHCLTPFLEVTLHSTKDSAKAKIDSLENLEEDDPHGTLNVVEEWEVCH